MARRVRARARDRCEYCLLEQQYQEATFHVDHVEPRVSGGLTVFGNLALACVSCSLRKGAKSEAVDPSSQLPVRLFNPRKDNWQDHFELLPDFRIVGRTGTGRATSEALRMNRPLAIDIRREGARRGG
jgi:hypothetical protein